MLNRWLKTILFGLVALYVYRAQQSSHRFPLPLIRGASSDYISPGDKRRPPLSLFLATATRGDDDTAGVPNATEAPLQALLDFAIVGHPKTGTTYLLEWLGRQPEILAYDEEVYALQHGNLTEFVELLYRLPAGSNYKRGYKAPRDICNSNVLDVYRQHFSQTRLVVGLRHPIRWFESFYNYRTRHNVSLPPPDSPIMIGACSEPVHGVCTDESLFHYHLASLGKVNLTEDSQDLFPPLHWSRLRRYLDGRGGMPNPVFLYDVSQLNDDNATRAALFRQDLTRFLRLQRPLEAYVREKSNRTKLRVLDICRPAYGALRAELLRNAQWAATWIRRHFLDADRVHVSSRDHFESILDDWMVDPCTEAEDSASPADSAGPPSWRR